MDKTLDSEKEEHFFAGSIQGQSLILLLNKLQSQGTLHTSDLSSVLLSVGIKSMIDYLMRIVNTHTHTLSLLYLRKLAACLAMYSARRGVVVMPILSSGARCVRS